MTSVIFVLGTIRDLAIYPLAGSCDFFKAKRIVVNATVVWKRKITRLLCTRFLTWRQSASARNICLLRGMISSGIEEHVSMVSDDRLLLHAAGLEVFHMPPMAFTEDKGIVYKRRKGQLTEQRWKELINAT